ncbi:MAG: dATP/dGTP diphosphohydrolase domain-containing protein [candidate division NC10 bacterium]
MADEALRFNEGKVELARLFEFGAALDNLVAVMTQGAIKYEDGNWLKGGKRDYEYVNSALRHLNSFLQDETYDPETGCHHLAHVTWNMLAAMRLNYGDDPAIDPDFDQTAFVRRWSVDPTLDDEPEDVAVRALYEGEIGQFNYPGAATWYADGGRKVTLTGKDWKQAVDFDVLVYLD